MTGLIDKKCALEAVKALPAELDAETVQRCIEVLSNQPTVDAIPIDFIVEFKEDYCDAKSEKCDIGIANALVELMLCWEDEQEEIEWRNDHERIPSKQQSVDAIPISYIQKEIEDLEKSLDFYGSIGEYDALRIDAMYQHDALTGLLRQWRSERKEE